ncbi:APC family permease [Actinokineospora globicatena]|uniref:Amino acid transporter n=1 Tax=Actinokineospora globicatena TaxID=103729 RepID=A0A9W6QKU8_9PSEU|nr:APC family permease [Actinokineospora globicatena]MCP2302661.1 amino acid/polyamine/organocation transporter, APC superfamily [Actinokineospora globicatena]GLW75652.1 amino acid transporter [Actinokineospora globicatena]GLW82492.1 amino acid transporter [Actinokineospora globicatena]GLW91437.1 amino acid transporter [Actinokineospora globicatena]
MSKFSTAAKRLVVGRPFRSDRLAHTLLPKRIALPVFASDAMSSVAYAPEEIFLMLSVAGLSAYTFAPWVGVVVVVVMLTVVASYRQNVRAYPSGGGDYEVATVNLGKQAGLTVASALLVDYVLTVAVSIASAAANIGSAIPFVATHKVEFSVVAIVVLTAINLRGIRESGAAFAVPTYAFMVGIILMIGFGLFRGLVLGDDLRAESADLQINAEHGELAGLALVFLVLRAFSSGCAALTGVEAISNGVPAFRKPKSKNAATTLLLMGGIAVVMLMGLIVLAQLTQVRVAEDPATQLVNAPAGYEQKTMVAQIAGAVFDGFPVGFFFITIVTALILVLAANTAFNGFPVLGSILAQDRYLPRQLHTRGDRLAFSNGIIGLAGFAIVLVIAFDAEVTRLIQLYIVGVFVSFTMSQTGMIRHWNRKLAGETDPVERRRMRRAQAINAFGLAMTGSVLVVVLITKFLLGAWIAIAAMAGIYLVMTGIRRHYDRVAAELAKAEGDTPFVLPSRIHTIVLVSKLHLPTRRALAYARATRPDVLEAITVNVDDVDTKKLVGEWDKENFSVPLKVIESPYREITKPVLDYVKRIRTDNPRDVVTVFIPEYVVGRWWEQVLHNQSALRLKGRLLFQPGVMVTSVPWQLASSEKVAERDLVAPGAIRRGLTGKDAPK